MTCDLCLEVVCDCVNQSFYSKWVYVEGRSTKRCAWTHQEYDDSFQCMLSTGHPTPIPHDNPVADFNHVLDEDDLERWIKLCMKLIT